MPVSALLLDADLKVKRSPSLRSEHSSVSESRQVRFNQDVSVKTIPKKVTKTKSLDRSGGGADEFSARCAGFTNIPPPSEPAQIADEAETILRQLQEIQCSVSSSPTPRIQSPTRQVTSPPPGPGSRQPSQPPSRTGTLEKRNSGSQQSLLSGLVSRFSRSSSDLVRGGDRRAAMRVEGYSEQEDSPSGGDHDRFYGLQALSNLDNAVNGGQKMNNLYKMNNQPEYSVPVKKNNITPPKPPRKAPSASPPSVRRGYLSHDELDFKARRSELFERDTADTELESAVSGAFSYTDKNPGLHHLRQQSPSRQSPSRGQGNHTDSELLSSPHQVLYATISADKHRHHGSNLAKNHYMANSASQTIHSGFRPISADRHLQSRTSSKENILDDPPYRMSNGGGGGSGKHGTRSLERFVDDDKENFKRRQEMKARIHVSSPIRMSPDRESSRTAPAAPSSSRKPYRTTINTATDTIQYNGFSRDNLRHRARDAQPDNEHYKVPRNKPAPVPPEFITRNGLRMESDQGYNSGHGSKGSAKTAAKSQFSSASLVRSAERRGGSSSGHVRGARGEYDREGRRIPAERNNRAYSGYSTSPDRELSPDRYAKPRHASNGHAGGHGRSMVRRSPSTSPTRPPRTKSSPSREVHIPVRREHSGRVVERTPSTRAAATSRSPIKKIQRVHNEIVGESPSRAQSPGKARTLTLTRNKGDKAVAGARGAKTILLTKGAAKEPGEDDRLSRFTEYRGTSEEPRGVLASGRRSSAGYDLRKNSDSSGGGGQFERERERGQSVPPGANIESMKDFYKTTQYRSMYHLPPSPSRPAPVLQRERSSDVMIAPPRRHAKNSVSEGELTDEVARAERVVRQRNKFISGIPGRQQQPDHGATLSRPHRVVSGDRDRNNIYGELNNQRRVGSKERPVRRQAPQPPTQKVRRSSVDVLETSHSESESPRPDQLRDRLYSDEELDWSEPVVGGTRHRITVTHHHAGPGQQRPHVARSVDRHVQDRPGHVLYLDGLDPGPHHQQIRYQTKLNGVPAHSDIDSDYRRDMIAGSVHSEARARDGGHVAPPSIYQQAATLARDKSASRSKLDSLMRGRSTERGTNNTREVEISQDEVEEAVMSREEERRKIIELERRQAAATARERSAGPGSASVSRSSSRVSKLGIPGLKSKSRVAQLAATETENESQYSGHSGGGKGAGLKPRYASPGAGLGAGRVKRTGSSATTSSARQVISRKKMPGSVTSSINSSESEHGSGAGQSAISRATNQSAASNRSVYLHATAVADIPSAKPGSGGGPGPAAPIGETKQYGSSSLQKSKKISRSISLLAPFKKQQAAARGAGPEKEVIYDSSGQIVGPHSGSGKPPRAPPAPVRMKSPAPAELPAHAHMSRDKKFASSSDLLVDEGEVMSSPETDPSSRAQSKVSRSVSMPKDTRLAGWFKKRKRV